MSAPSFPRRRLDRTLVATRFHEIARQAEIFAAGSPNMLVDDLHEFVEWLQFSLDIARLVVGEVAQSEETEGDHA